MKEKTISEALTMKYGCPAYLSYSAYSAYDPEKCKLQLTMKAKLQKGS